MRSWQRQESEKIDLPNPLYAVSGLSILLPQWHPVFLVAVVHVFATGFSQPHSASARTSRHFANDIELQFELRIAALKHMAKHLYEGER